MTTVTLAASLALLAPAVGGNLLTNPSFDEPTPAPWQPRAWQGQADCHWSLDPPGHAGGHCATIRSATGADAAWTVTVAVEPSTWYRLSGWVKCQDLRGAVGALFNLQNMQGVRTPRVTGTTGWTQVSTAFHTEQQTSVEVNCLFGGWGSATGQAWYDDVELVRLPGPPPPEPARVSVDTAAPTTPASPFLRGGFIEHFDGQIYGGLCEPGSPLSDERGFRRDVLAALRELKLSIVRWPGGCFASGYHWRDGVGPTRTPVPDPVWGVTDPNTFGTDEFVEWCRRVGCEPYICTNAGNGTPEEMRDWVAYCRARGHNVRYWSIGNENWGGHEIGARTPAEWGPLVLRSAQLMRAADPNLTLLAAATPDRGWTLPLLATAGKQLDQVAIHEYWLGLWANNQQPDYATCITHADGPEATLGRVIAVLDEAGVRGRVKIAFDEWNLRGWHHPGFPRKAPTDPHDAAAAALIKRREDNAIASQYTLADALFSASFLNACLRHAGDVGMACIAPIVNTRGPLYVHPGGLVKRTTYHVLAMYGQLLGERVANAEVSGPRFEHGGRSVATLDAVATCDAAGAQWRLALLNRHPSERLRVEVRLGGRALTGKLAATVLDGDSPEAYNSVEQPDRVVPRRVELVCEAGSLDLPPHSVTIVAVPASAVGG